MLFRDRRDAGLELASHLRGRLGPDAVVVAIARGGVPVAAEVATVLAAPLAMWGVRKLRIAAHPSVVLGAVAEGGGLHLNQEAAKDLALNELELEAIIAQERAALATQLAPLREGHPLPSVEHADVVLVDDGVLTGSTARAAIRAIRAQHPRRLVLAVPLGYFSVLNTLRADVDEVVCLHPRKDLSQLTVWFREPAPLTDAELARLLDSAAARWQHAQAPCREHQEVTATVDGVTFHGSLTVPDAARGLVVWGHGHAGHARNERNAQVARALNRGGLATFLVEPPPEAERALAGEQVEAIYVAATRWARQQNAVRALPVSFLAVGPASQAAIRAAAREPASLSALVLEDAPLGLEVDALSKLAAPTLLIVGENDSALRASYPIWTQHMRCPSDIVVIPGASYLFSEPGTLGEATHAAQQWFLRHVPAPSLSGSHAEG